MKPINSAIPPLRMVEPTQIGTQLSAHGSGTALNGALNAQQSVPLSSEEELNKLSRLSTGLLKAWAETEYGQPLQHNLTPSQLTATISFLDRARAPAESPSQVLTVLKQMLIAYVQPGKDIHEDAVKAWLYVLEGQPLASIIECARAQLKSPDEWAPKPGQFLAKVQSHADGLKHLQRRLKETIPTA